MPIRFADRTVGVSKISLGIAIEALWLVPVLRFPVLGHIWPARNAPFDDMRASGERRVGHAYGSVTSQMAPEPP